MDEERGVTVTAMTCRGRVEVARLRLPTVDGCRTAAECVAVMRAQGAHAGVEPVGPDAPDPTWREVRYWSPPKRARLSRRAVQAVLEGVRG